MLFNLSKLSDTQQFAKDIADILMGERSNRSVPVGHFPNFVITLDGVLGAGKTTLARGIIQALGIKGTVKSPTFTLMESYTLKLEDIPFKVKDYKKSDAELHIYHFDLYRFSDPEEWFMAGFDEYFENNSICLIEWASKAIGLIPRVDWGLELSITTDGCVTCVVDAKSHLGKLYLEKLLLLKSCYTISRN